MFGLNCPLYCPLRSALRSGPMVINGASLPESLLEALGMPSGGGFQIKLVRSGACQVQLPGRPAGPAALLQPPSSATIGTPRHGQQGQLQVVKQVQTCLLHAPAGHFPLPHSIAAVPLLQAQVPGAFPSTTLRRRARIPTAAAPHL